MWWIFFLVLAVAPIVVLVMKLDQQSKAFNRLKVQLHFAEQQSVQVEHLAFWLAEEQSQQLISRLQHWVRQQAKLPLHAPHLEQLFKAIPTLCRDQANKGLTPKQSFGFYLKKHSELTMNDIENFLRHYPILTELWQSNTLTSYFKLCHKGLEILQEQSSTAPDRRAS
ncbi:MULTISPECIES: hypothetical protein [Rheinheimera]|uniref:DUF4381 domain-containing protein n=1 Tax=Rheinheimera marina TaxID=1774958 RepID=A0ABV9JGS2_9GAMM